MAPQASGDYTTQESQASFTNGNVVFMRNWPFMYGLLSDPEISQVKPGQVDIGALPVADEGDTSFSGLGGWNFMVNAGAEDKIEEIWAFIEFMSALEQQQTFAVESARLPTLRSLYGDDEVLDKLPVAKLVSRGARERPPAPRLAPLLGHVPGDGRGVQRRPQGRGSRGRGARQPPEEPAEHSGSGVGQRLRASGFETRGKGYIHQASGMRNRKAMCYAAGVAESGGLYVRNERIAFRFGLPGFSVSRDVPVFDTTEVEL